VQQELLTLPEHLKSLLIIGGVRVGRSLIVDVVFCTSLFVIFSFFSIFAIVLSVRLRCMPSDYPFGTFKLFTFVNECFMWNQCIPFIYVIGIHNEIVFLLRMNYKVG
jgi:hypothetical protein